MRTTSTIPIGTDEATLFVDILSDPPAVAIRRAGGGLVQVQPDEIRHLAEVLTLHASMGNQDDMGLYWQDDGGGLWRLWCDDRKNHGLVVRQDDGRYFWRVFATNLWRDPGGAYHLVELADLRRLVDSGTRQTPGGPVVEGTADGLGEAREIAAALVRRARTWFLRAEVKGR